MTRKQAEQLGRVLMAWSEGAVVERRSSAEPGAPWQAFRPGREGSIATYYQEWRIVAAPEARPGWWRRFGG
jgi:hypothetical protein